MSTETLTVDSGRIADYERWAIEQPQVPIVTRHFFTPGIYAREIVVPAGTVITGAEHRTDYIAVLSQGVVSVWQEDGEPPALLRAPLTIVSKVGARRMGLVHEDMIWTDFFPNPTEDRDVDRIMARLVNWPEVYSQLHAQPASPCLQ